MSTERATESELPAAIREAISAEMDRYWRTAVTNRLAGPMLERIARLALSYGQQEAQRAQQDELAEVWGNVLDRISYRAAPPQDEA